MKKMVNRGIWSAALGAALCLLPACQANTMRGQSAVEPHTVQRQQTIDNELKAKSLLPHHGTEAPDMKTVPGVDRMKTKTTNEFGGTSYGLGSSVYSIIGSSGLHSQGLSSHLESRLGSAGLANVRAFAIDDIVILATDKARTHAAQYDSLQRKLLSGSAGMSGTGPDTGDDTRIGVKSKGAAGETHDNLAQAEKWVHDHMGSVNVYTVTSPEAVRLIERIRSHTGGANASADLAAADIQKLLRLAMQSR